jgi:hypothetical protein
MSRPASHAATTLRRSSLLLAVGVLVVAAVTGCNTGGVSSAPVATSTATAGTTAATSPSGGSEGPLDTAIPSDASGGPGVVDVTQTDTAWGRIWDEVPRAFPVYPGSEESTEVGAPASAQFVVPTDVATATAWLKRALDTAGFTTSVNGPLEDGSTVIDASAANGCAAQVTIARTGTVTLETVMYGARCAFS